jgi:hypothetical protein
MAYLGMRAAEIARRTDPYQVAKQIVDDLELRATYFETPGKAIAQAVPSARPFGLGVDPETRALRRQVAAKMEKAIEDSPRAASSAHAHEVMRDMFKGEMRTPELTFWFILVLSALAFFAASALVVASLIIAFTGSDSTQDAIIAAIFGGSGVGGTLAAVYSLTRRGVSEANINYACIRVVLWGFAAEFGHLRALDLKTPPQVDAANKRIGEATRRAVYLIQRRIKMETAGAVSPAADTPPAPPVEMEGNQGGP